MEKRKVKSLYNYSAAFEILQLDPPFAALIMAAMRKASSGNFAKLVETFPEIWEELKAGIEAEEGSK